MSALPAVGDAVLVDDDYGDEWDYPGIVVSVDDDANPQVHVKPLSEIYEEQPCAPHNCLILQKGLMRVRYTDRTETEDLVAYKHPKNNKLYFVPKPDAEPDSFLEEEAWFEADGVKWDLDEMELIGDLEDQSE